MLLNKAEIFKALSAYEGNDKKERSIATLQAISEEFVSIRDEFEKKEVEKAETEKNMKNLKAVIQSCNHGLTEDEAEAVAKIVSNLKIKTNTKKGERPSSDIFDDIFRYLW